MYYMTLCAKSSEVMQYLCFFIHHRASEDFVYSMSYGLLL